MKKTILVQIIKEVVAARNKALKHKVNEGTGTSWKELWTALQGALDKEDEAESDKALKLIAKVAGSKVKGGIERGAAKVKSHLEDKYTKK